jgi:Carotenoid biosynthesis protein
MDLVLGTLVLRPYVFAFLASYVIVGAMDLGWRRTLLFGAWVWPVAWLSEFSSTRTGVPFGLYTYTGHTRGQELFVADVPFMDPLSFTFLAYASFCLARAVVGRRGAPGAVTILGGIFMMLLDVVIDPVAVRGHRWFLGHIFYYPNGGFYFGVPLANFVGWLVVGLIGIGGYVYWTGGFRSGQGAPRASASPPAHGGDGYGAGTLGGVALYYAVLGFNLAVTAWIGEWALLACGVILHATVAALLWVLRRWPVAWTGMESQKA